MSAFFFASTRRLLGGIHRRVVVDRRATMVSSSWANVRNVRWVVGSIRHG